jgi:hypothetical protein
VPDTDTIVVEIFDPPLCCPSGLCGPTVDPALLDINEALLRVKQQYDGQLTVERYTLPHQVGKFMQTTTVMAILRSQGAGALPITLVGGRILVQGRYPSYEELADAVAAPGR